MDSLTKEVSEANASVSLDNSSGDSVRARLEVLCPECRTPMSCPCWNDCADVATRVFECLDEGCFAKHTITVRVYGQ